MIDIYEMEKEFDFKENVFSNQLDQIKQIMLIKLTATEKRLLILYCNAGSTRKAQTLCNIKSSQIARIVSIALKKIRLELKRIDNKNNKIIK